MTTILACDVLPDMVIRTAFDPEGISAAVAVATFRVTYVNECDGAVCIHTDSPSSRIFEIPDYVQVQVLKWPSYAHEAVDTDPEVTQSWQEDPELEADNEALRKAMAEDDGTRVPFRACLPDLADLPTGATERARLNQVILALEKQDERIEKLGQLCSDQVEAAVERVLRRQDSEGQHPSSGGK